jgi:arsenate reductase-like glutaredoxin family protein
MKIKEIKMTVRRVQEQDIIISAENGFDMPQTANELVETVANMKNNPEQYINEKGWYYTESSQITEIDVIEQD